MATTPGPAIAQPEPTESAAVGSGAAAQLSIDSLFSAAATATQESVVGPRRRRPRRYRCSCRPMSSSRSRYPLVKPLSTTHRCRRTPWMTPTRTRRTNRTSTAPMMTRPMKSGSGKPRRRRRGRRGRGRGRGIRRTPESGPTMTSPRPMCGRVNRTGTPRSRATTRTRPTRAPRRRPTRKNRPQAAASAARGQSRIGRRRIGRR